MTYDYRANLEKHLDTIVAIVSDGFVKVKKDLENLKSETEDLRNTNNILQAKIAKLQAELDRSKTEG